MYSLNSNNLWRCWLWLEDTEEKFIAILEVLTGFLEFVLSVFLLVATANYIMSSSFVATTVSAAGAATAVGAFAKIYKDKITVEAELFSLDGSERFYFKSSKNIRFASELGKEVGEILKKQSKNSYKK